MSTGKSRPKYHPNYVNQVLKIAPSQREPMTNVKFSQIIGVTEGAIRKWRKEHSDFDRAFIDGESMWMERTCKALWDSLDAREEITVIKDANGVKEIKKQVLPTHNDSLAVQKSGLRKPLAGYEQQARKAIIREIRKRLFADEITYVEAASECEEEGFDIPESWKRREIARIIKLKTACELTALEAAQLLESEGITVPKTLMLEVQKSIGIVDSNSFEPTIIEFVSPGEGDVYDNGKN